MMKYSINVKTQYRVTNYRDGMRIQSDCEISEYEDVYLMMSRYEMTKFVCWCANHNTK